MAIPMKLHHALDLPQDNFLLVPSRSDPPAPPQPSVTLASLANPNFIARLLSAPFHNLDYDSKGYFTFEDFEAYFSSYASSEEARTIFDMITMDENGQVAYDIFTSFQKLHDVEPTEVAKGKVGSPDFLGYVELLEGIHWACVREAFSAKLIDDHVQFPPSDEWLFKEMAQEWDALAQFRTHWLYVLRRVPCNKEKRRYPDWNGGYSVRDAGHEGMTLYDFCQHPVAMQAGLTRSEVLSLRLYTGPGYGYLNRSLRSNSRRFPATQYCIDMAIGKLAQFSNRRTLLFGMEQRMHHRWVRQYDLYCGIGHKKLVVSDPGFLSTTTDVKVATSLGAPTFFQIQTSPATKGNGIGFLGNGADVQWVSQYPQEAETLFPSNVLLIPRRRCKHLSSISSELPEAATVHQFFAFYPWNFQDNTPVVTKDYLVCANDLLRHLHAMDLEFAAECKLGAGHKDTYCFATDHPEDLKKFEALPMPSSGPPLSNPSFKADGAQFELLEGEVSGGSMRADIEVKLNSEPVVNKPLSILDNYDSPLDSFSSVCNLSPSPTSILSCTTPQQSRQGSHTIKLDGLFGSNLIHFARLKLYNLRDATRMKGVARSQHDDGLDMVEPSDANSWHGIPPVVYSSFLGSSWDPGALGHMAAGFFLALNAPILAASSFAPLMFLLTLLLASMGVTAIVAAPSIIVPLSTRAILLNSTTTAAETAVVLPSPDPDPDVIPNLTLNATPSPLTESVPSASLYPSPFHMTLRPSQSPNFSGSQALNGSPAFSVGSRDSPQLRTSNGPLPSFIHPDSEPPGQSLGNSGDPASYASPSPGARNHSGFALPVRSMLGRDYDCPASTVPGSCIIPADVAYDLCLEDPKCRYVQTSNTAEWNRVHPNTKVLRTGTLSPNPDWISEAKTDVTWTCIKAGSAFLPISYADEVQCLGAVGKDCAWATSLAECQDHIVNQSAISQPPFKCGAMHQASRYGITGYDTPGHWCDYGLKLLSGCTQINRFTGTPNATLENAAFDTIQYTINCSKALPAGSTISITSSVPFLFSLLTNETLFASIDVAECVAQANVVSSTVILTISSRDDSQTCNLPANTNIDFTVSTPFDHGTYINPPRGTTVYFVASTSEDAVPFTAPSYTTTKIVTSIYGFRVVPDTSTGNAIFPGMRFTLNLATPLTGGSFISIYAETRSLFARLTAAGLSASIVGGGCPLKCDVLWSRIIVLTVVSGSGCVIPAQADVTFLVTSTDSYVNPKPVSYVYFTMSTSEDTQYYWGWGYLTT